MAKTEHFAFICVYVKKKKIRQRENAEGEAGTLLVSEFAASSAGFSKAK